MKYYPYSKCDPDKNFSPMPNEVYYIGLSYGAIAVYGYLLHIENRKAYQTTLPATPSARRSR